LVVTLLSVCGGCRYRAAESSETLYKEAYSAFRGERFADALEKTGRGLEQTPADSAWYWNFRLLNAQILLGKREALNAQKALRFEFPPKFRTPQNLARQSLGLGFAANLLQDVEQAKLRLAEAETLARAAGNGELLAEIQNRQGLVAVAEGREDDSARLFAAALEYSTNHSVRWLSIAVTGNQGFRHMRAHRYEEALPYLNRAVAAAHEAGELETEARNVGNAGFCYYRMGDLDKALQAFQTAEERFRSTGNRYERQVWLGSVGNIHLGRYEYPEATTYYQQALTLARALGDKGDAASWLSNLARISLETGDLDAAERYNNEGLALKRELHLKDAQFYSALNSARISFRRGKFGETETIVREILRVPQNDPTPRLKAHNELAAVMAATHRYRAAETEFRATIAEIERQRTELLTDDNKRAYLSSLIGFYQDYVEFLMDRGRTGEALTVADSSHGRTMLEKLRLSSVSQTREQRPADFQRIARASGSTLLIYWLGRQSSYLWIVTPGSIRAVSLPVETKIRPLIEAYDKSIQALQDPLAQENTAARQLYEAIVAPATPFLAGTRRVTVIPDGVLYSLNFETLPVPGPAPHYWIEDVTLSIAPALSLLNAERKPAAKNTSLLLIGNPASPDPEFPNLAFAGQEIGAIEASLPLSRKVVLQGRDAHPGAWAQVQPGGFDLIHFTAHATASREEPLESAVILSRDAEGGFKLHAKDVVKIPLSAYLVTISACRSAGSRIYSGEGLVGLAWAFLEAGAHNVIAGLWDVNDESGAKTMARLYGGLASGRGAADALRDAKLELIHSGGVYRKPWYWGAFQLFTTDARN
jgi:CHAT domain-containing protein/Tfp pilus assembly protein PilF